MPLKDDAQEHSLGVLLLWVIPADCDALQIPLWIHPLVIELAIYPDVDEIVVVDLSMIVLRASFSVLSVS